MTFWSSLFLFLLTFAIQSPNTNASGPQVFFHSCAGGEDCKPRTTSGSRSSASTPETEAVSDPEFEKLAQLSADGLNSMKEDGIRVLGKATLENLYWESTRKDLREDPAKKAALCRIAAIGGYPAAIGEYANMLFAGRGVPQNQREALNWYLKSAQAENEESITFLDRLLKEGTFFSDFNITDASEHAAITSSIEEAYERLQSRWEMEE